MSDDTLRVLAKMILNFIPEDKSDVAGYGPFALSEGHPFHRAGAPHDYYFEQAKLSKDAGLSLTHETLNQADLKLFRMFAIIAENAPTEDEKLKLAMDCCLFWPIARRVGKALWRGPTEGEAP